MTGFGNAEKNGFRVEIRSLNHRFIDISIKMPPYLSQYDIPLRNILKERFYRGRFDVTISTDGNRVAQLNINKEMAKKIYNALQELQKELSMPGQIDIHTLTGYRELLAEEEPQYDADTLYASFYEAVSHLETMREKEGKLLSEELRKRTEVLSVVNNRIQSLTSHVFEKCRKRLTERLGVLLGTAEMDSTRVMQEAAMMAERLDISEEVSRLENHIKRFFETLDEGGAIGKKLDFLLQEMSREVNTIAAKSGDYTISSLTVDMKTEIEKMREQVQNIQ